MPQTQAATCLPWTAWTLSAFRSPSVLLWRNFAMTPRSMSTRWSQHFAARRAAPSAPARTSRTGSPPLAKAAMYSRSPLQAAFRAAAARHLPQRNAARSRIPLAAFLWWTRCPPVRRSPCSSKSQPPNCAPARASRRSAQPYSSISTVPICSLRWNPCTISLRTDESASWRQRWPVFSASAPLGRPARRARLRCSANVGALEKRRSSC